MVILYIKKNDFDEYEVVWEEDGRRDEGKTYYAEDLWDAKRTLESEFWSAKHKGFRALERRIRYNRFYSKEDFFSFIEGLDTE